MYNPRYNRFALPLFSLLLLGLLEAGLRGVGLGGFPDLVKARGEMNGKVVHEVQPAATQSYFSESVYGRGSGRISTFYEPKGTNVIRVVLAGESAILGLMQPPPLTAASFLKWGLERSWPGRRVELINLGTTAVASYPVYDMVRQIVPYAPDLLVIYCGNNEFFGAFGVSSTHFAGISPRFMPIVRSVQGLAIYQGLSRLAALFDRPPGVDKTLMERMISVAYIPHDSVDRARAERNLRYNLNKIIDVCMDANIPVILCTLASNERDLWPLGSGEGDNGVGETEARAAFLSARKLYDRGNYQRAQELFEFALDRDTMPWRPTSRLNSVIKDVAQSRNVMFCDVQSHFRQISPGGSIGWELMDDHVHFSLAGQYALALSLMRSLVDAPGSLRVEDAALRAMPDWSDVAAELGNNPYESFASAWSLYRLFQSDFMKSTNPRAQDFMIERMRQAADQMDVRIAKEFTSQWMERSYVYAEHNPASSLAGALMVDVGIFDAAIPVLDFASRSLAEYSPLRRLCAALMYRCIYELNQLTDDHMADLTLEIARGLTLLRHGGDPSGRTELAIAYLNHIAGRPDDVESFKHQAYLINPNLHSQWPTSLLARALPGERIKI